jgi:hypothetical protein
MKSTFVLFQPTNVQIYHDTFSLYNVPSYMFRLLYVILSEFKKIVPRKVT